MTEEREDGERREREGEGTQALSLSSGTLGLLVDKDDLINYQLLIIYQLLILEGLLMIVDKVWKLTNTSRVGLDAPSSHTQRQSTFPDNVCSYCPPCHGVSHNENLTTFLFFHNNQSVFQKEKHSGKLFLEIFFPSLIQNGEEK